LLNFSSTMVDLKMKVLFLLYYIFKKWYEENQLNSLQ